MWLKCGLDTSSAIHYMVLQNINQILVDVGVAFADYLRQDPDALAHKAHRLSVGVVP
jgi:hypothetical protein